MNHDPIVRCSHTFCKLRANGDGVAMRLKLSPQRIFGLVDFPRLGFVRPEIGTAAAIPTNTTAFNRVSVRVVLL